MAPKREERLLMRQRGAATRQIKNTGFDLVLPGQEYALLQPRQSGRERKTLQSGLVPQRSSRRTPAPDELLPQKSTRRTPASNDLPPQRSSRRTPATGTVKKVGQTTKAPIAEEEIVEELPETQAKHDEEDGFATKKRKAGRTQRPAKALTTREGPQVQVSDSQPAEQDPSAQPGSGAKKRKKRKSIGQQAMKTKSKQAGNAIRHVRPPHKKALKPTPDPPMKSFPSPNEQLLQEAENVITSIEEIEQSQLIELNATSSVEDEHAGQHTERMPSEARPKAGKRKRNTVDVQPRKRTKPSSSKGDRVSETTGGMRTADHVAEANVMLDRINDVGVESADVGISEQGSTLEETKKHGKSKVRRKKRKSIGQQRPKRKSTDLITLAKVVGKKKPVSEPSAPVEYKQAGTPKSFRPVRKLERSLKSLQNESGGEREVSEAEETQIEASQPTSKHAQPKMPVPSRARQKASTAASTKPQTPKSKPRAKATRAAPPQTRNPPKNSIPITIYGPPSPASTASNSDVFEDPLATTAGLPRPTNTINAADVLSQICREMITKIATSFAEKAVKDPARRGEWKRKRRTVEMYREELEARLLQLTRVLNSNATLNVQVRAATKTERALRKEIKELQAETEATRLRKEEVLKAKKARELEELLSGIAGAVKRGWALQVEEAQSDVVAGMVDGDA